MDEVAELLVALLHSLFAAVGFDQHLQSIGLRLFCPNVGFPNLSTNRTGDLSESVLRCSIVVRVEIIVDSPS